MFWQHACLDITKHYPAATLPRVQKKRGVLRNQRQRQEKKKKGENMDGMMTWKSAEVRGKKPWEWHRMQTNLQTSQRRNNRKGKEILTPLEDTGPRCSAGSRAWCTSPRRPPSRSWQCASPRKRTSFCGTPNTKGACEKLEINNKKWVVCIFRRRHKHGSATASGINTPFLVSKQ